MIAPFASLKRFSSGGFIGRRESYVAFDIGSSSVKMVEAALDRNGWRLLNVGVAALPARAVQNNMIVETGIVSDVLRKLVSDHNVKATKVISAVPGRSVIMKKFELPAQKDDELEANIEFEANKVIPESLENVNFDYQLLKSLDDGSKVEVLLVAVRKEIVNSYAEVIENAGLHPAIMDVDYFAMESMYETNYEPQTTGEVIGLIHIGSRYTSINVLSNGISTFTGDLPVGGEEFTEALRRTLQISAEDAEAVKLTGEFNGKPYPELDNLLRPTAETLADDIRRNLSLYGAVASEDAIQTVYLTGGSAKVRVLPVVMEEKLGVPVHLADPFRGFQLDKNIDRDYLAESASQLSVGVGLATRRPGDK